MFKGSALFAGPSTSSQVSPLSCKRNRAAALAVVVGLSGLAVQPALCQEGIQSSAVVLGRVLDAASGQPIVALEVRLVRNGDEVVRYTGGDGTFVFPPVQPGTYEIVLTHLAYGSHSDSVEAEVGELVNYEARLAMQPIELAPLTVTVERRRISPMHLGFYERMALHVGGAFITREDIELRQPLRITHMIAELPGGRRALRHGCGVYIDRMYMGTHGPDVWIDREVLPTEIEAVEVYDGPASLPAEFGGSRNTCAFVIWTRRGTGGELANTWEADTSIWNTLAIVAVVVPSAILALLFLFWSCRTACADCYSRLPLDRSATASRSDFRSGCLAEATALLPLPVARSPGG